MNIKKEVLKPAIFLAMAVLVLCMSVSTVYADFGFHPTYVIKIMNAPDAYYYAILDSIHYGSPPQAWDSGKENSELHLDRVDEESVNAYLQDFRYDEWYCSYSKCKHSNESNEITYTHQYNPFRIIIFQMDGSVHLSPVMKERQSFFYDFQTGELRSYEHGYKGIPKLVKYVILCLVMTFFFEFIVFGFFGFAVCRKNVSAFWFINVATNVPFALLLNLIAMIESRMFNFITIFIVLEVIIAFIEAYYFSRVLVDKKGNHRPKRAFVCGLVANVCSAVCGAIFSVLALAHYLGLLV